MSRDEHGLLASDEEEYDELALENGGCERSRTACVIVGWNRPPNGECARRWVGRVCPKLKKSENALTIEIHCQSPDT